MDWRHPTSCLALLLACVSARDGSLGASPGERHATAPAPVPVPADWLAQAQAGLARREYQPSRGPRGWQAPNRAHNLRTYFDSEGVRLVDRTAPSEPELARLALAGVGRSGRLAPVPPGEVSSPPGRAERVEIRRPGLVEWYENRPEGLEQGFTVEHRPNGDGELRLALDLGSAHGRVQGDGLVLTSAAGRELRYDGLVVNDARGQVLTARVELREPQRIEIAIDDQQAVYPLLVDPLITAIADATFQTPLAFVYMGGAVSSAGDVNGDGYGDILIGASGYDNDQGDEGAVFVYLGGPAGIASGNPSSADTVLQGNQNNAAFGSSVSAAGDVNGDGYDDIVVGASVYDSGETDEGAAFVYLGGPSGIASGGPATAAAVIQTNQASAVLTSAAGAGDVNGDGYADVVVGAQTYDLGETDEGIALVYLGGPSGIAGGGPANANATLQCNQASCRLGFRVASAGDLNADGHADVVVTAQGFNAGETFEGGAFVFLGGPAGISSGSPATANSTFQTNQFNGGSGLKASAAGDVNGDGYGDLIVGSSLFTAGEGNEGAAFVLLGGPAGIPNGSPATANTVLQANLALTQFGSDVASAGDVDGDGYADVIVGAFAYDGGQTDEGAAFVYLGGPGGIPSGSLANAFVKLESNQASAFYGGAVASAGDVNGDGYAEVLVGASSFDGAQTDGGAAFLYLGGAAVPRSGDPTAANTRLQDSVPGRFGWSVAGAGDVNGDGYADVIVGADLYDAGQPGEGAAFVFLGGPGGVASGGPATALAMLQGNLANAGFGHSVAGAGDVNGDGYADVIVGPRTYDFGDPGEVSEGAAFVYLGGPAGIASGSPASAATTIQANQSASGMGWSVAGAGDVNGDGYGDVLVGAYSYDAGETNEGAAFVFLGGPAGIPDGSPATAAAVLAGNQAGAFMGLSVASAGDVNGDGYADAIVGARDYDSGESNEGAAFVFLGGPAGIASGGPATAAATLQADQAGANMGASVSGAGDVNGDGYGDVIVGAIAYDQGETNEGAAFVFLGGPAGLASGGPSAAAATIQADQASALMGASVAGAGDVNGDGYADVIVGAEQYGAGELFEGIALVFAGGPAGIPSGNPATASALLQANQFGAKLGHGVAGAGDVNGDGFADVIVGAGEYNGGNGLALVLLGNRGRNGRPVLARQLRANASTPVQPFGLSQSGSAYQLRSTATSSSGRRLLSLESEGCPAGSNWGTSGCVRRRSPWSEAPSGVALLTDTVSGLTPDRLYRWRTRTLYGPSADGPGVTPQAHPPHGPWRRLDGQAREADIRTSSVANLSVSVVDAPDPVVAGQSLSYVLAVGNSGPSAGKHVTVTQTLPLGLTVLGASGAGWSCAQVVSTVSCTRARLEASTGAPIVVEVLAPASGSLYSSATLTSSSIDPFAFDDFDDETTQVTPLADLSISKTNGQSVLVPGSAVTYTLVVANAGPANAAGASVTDALPGSLVDATWTCAASAGSSCPTSGSGSIAHGVNVLAGGSLTYTLNATVAVQATGVLTNVASVGVPASLADPLPGNNTAQDSDPLSTDADLAVSVSDGLGTATPGLPITYTLTVTNAGPPAASAATVASVIPTALSGASWTCAATAGSNCTPGPASGNIADTVNVLAGGTLTYTLNATVKPGATGSLTQQATVTPAPGHSDPSLGNNNASDTDALVPVTDLALTLSDTPDPLPVFGDVSYALTVVNAGPSDATGVALVQALPAGLAFALASPGCTNAAGNVSCALGGLPAGQARALTVGATAAPGTIGTLPVSAAVTGAESDPDGANNSAAQTTSVAFLKGDLDNDLQTDLLLRNLGTGANVAWLLDGVTRRTSALVTPDPQGLDWQVVGVDDFDGDHRNDLVLRDEVTGAVEFWLMGGATGTDRQGAAVPLTGGALAPPWKLSATADFDHDGQPDLVWRNFTTQKIEIWTMDGTTRVGTLTPTPDQAVDLHWEIVGAQDWNADGNTDFLWYNPDSGKIVLWFMDATVVRITGLFTNPSNAGDNNWKVLAMGDYGVGPGGLPDSKDIVWRNATSGNFVVWYMDAAGNRTFGTFTTPVAPPNPLGYTIVGPR